MNQPKQLSLAISLREETRFSNFELSGDDNAEALAHLSDCTRHVITQPGQAQNVLIWGNSGVGLSHLLQAVCHNFLAEGFLAQYLPLNALLNYDSDSICDGLESADLVCVDDIHLCQARTDWQLSLFHLFNALRDHGKCFVCASHVSPAVLPIELADLKSRLLSGTTFHVSGLDEDGLKRAFTSRAAERGLDINSDVINFIFLRSRRSTHDVFRLLDEIDEMSLIEKRKVTVPFVRELLLKR